MKKLLNPKSVAVIGASRDKTKLGRMILDNIISGGYTGTVYPVNPKSKKIAGLKCVKSVTEISKPLDLAVIAIPAKFVLQVVKECIEKKVDNIIVITSGFSETGKKGLALEYKIKKMLACTDTRLLGPNCLGIISTHAKLNATFARSTMTKGNIAFLSQSGALGASALDWAEKIGIGFSHFISLGNKADLTENDFLAYFDNDKNVKVIALYLEDFIDGRQFMQISRSISKPIIVLKPGKSEAAQAALSSHTGSLAQDDLIISSAMKQSGVIRVSTMEQLFNLMQLFSWRLWEADDGKKKQSDNRVAIITNAGGPGVITTDALAQKGLTLAKVSTKNKKLLSSYLPSAASVANPIDVLGDAQADRYGYTLETIAGDENVDSIIVLLTPQVMTEAEKTAKLIADVSTQTDKQIVTAFIGGHDVEKAKQVLLSAKVPTFSYPGDAVDALGYVHTYEVLEKSKHMQERDTKEQGRKGVKQKVTQLLADCDGVVDTQISEKILKAYSIPVLSSHFLSDIADARRAADKLSYPLVLKLIHPTLLHKTDIDGVRLGIENQQELEQAYEQLQGVAKKHSLDEYAIEMQHMEQGMLELILGIKYSPDQEVMMEGKKAVHRKGFGHTIMFGMGGIYAEVFKDVSLRVIPTRRSDIKSMIDETMVSKILCGARGKKFNITKIIDVIQKLSDLVSDFPCIRELDINPLFAKEKDIWVADVKMIAEGT